MRVLLLAALCLSLSACATTKVSLTTGPREYVASDYPQVLKKWTRSETLITVSDLDSKLTVTATLESWDFRWAYAIRYASDYRLTVEQRRAFLDGATKETVDAYHFYIALYGTNRRWTDLTNLQTSSWIIRLIDDVGDETAPLKIDQVLKPGAIERTYFPYTTVWRQVFRVTFPKFLPDGRQTVSTQARWLGLRFAGAEGNTELRWDLESEGDQKAVATAP
jgi:hypothetical protein